MGKPLAESRSEAHRAVSEMRFWAGEALRLGDRTFPSVRRSTEVATIREPIGPIAAITPWNFPILSPLRKVVPALVCGCPVVLKPALQAPGRFTSRPWWTGWACRRACSTSSSVAAPTSAPR
ncbi:aldehyde dehydrogenase family protein [Pseudonocardia nigra]|uniref:aldehyde dehydrogenase family protein n=1 Tax=Pseudonocardia nigra TaxID=1921578 RepID=UPI001C604EB9